MAVTAIVAGLGYFVAWPFALKALDHYFPEGEGAQMIDLERMQPCGFMPAKKKGKKPERIWCGVPDDFVGPIQDPRKVK